jgi:hypothetical protein
MVTCLPAGSLLAGNPGLVLVADTFDADPSALGRPDWPPCPAAQASLAAGSYRRAAAEWSADPTCPLPLLLWPQARLVTPRLHGFAPNPTSATDFWDAAAWWLDS